MESFNPQVLPSSLSKKDHHRRAQVALWAALGAIIIGVSYWAIAGSRKVDVTPPLPVTHTKTAAELRQEMIASLQTSTSAVTVDDTQKMITSLSKTKSTVTTEQRAEMINQLK
ncbi:MAG: hypothetical protein V4481_02250 [Patescibacteria group bacterium]